MRVVPYGAVRAVTGSMHLVEAGGVRVLLDCAGRAVVCRGLSAEVPTAGQPIEVA